MTDQTGLLNWVNLTYNSHSTFGRWVTLTQKIITDRYFKNSQMDMRGFVWIRGKFLKPWQVTDKIIDLIFPNSH